MSVIQCTECNTHWGQNQTCEQAFHTLGFWELDHNLYEVHHLMVLSYYLQHPAVMSREWLDGAKKLLVNFLENDLTPQQARQQFGATVDSSKRDYNIRATESSQAHYNYPIQWQMTIQDVVEQGMENYYTSVGRWAQSILEALRTSGNL